VVADTGATGGPGRARPFGVAQGRPLNRPRPLRVEVDGAGRPAALYLPSGCFGVEAVLERWRIDDEWWRERPVSRLYYRLALADGRTCVVYRNLENSRWFKQAY